MGSTAPTSRRPSASRSPAARPAPVARVLARFTVCVPSAESSASGVFRAEALCERDCHMDIHIILRRESP